MFLLFIKKTVHIKKKKKKTSFDFLFCFKFWFSSFFIRFSLVFVIIYFKIKPDFKLGFTIFLKKEGFRFFIILIFHFNMPFLTYFMFFEMMEIPYRSLSSNTNDVRKNSDRDCDEGASARAGTSLDLLFIYYIFIIYIYIECMFKNNEHQ